jgi:hypothetical protein
MIVITVDFRGAHDADKKAFSSGIDRAPGRGKVAAMYASPCFGSMAGSASRSGIGSGIGSGSASGSSSGAAGGPS